MYAARPRGLLGGGALKSGAEAPILERRLDRAQGNPVQVFTTTYRADHGWSAPLDRELDDPQTLVLAFGASRFADDARPFDDLAAAFPQSIIVGCSTAGEIAGSQVNDASVSVAVARFADTRLRLARADVSCAEQSGAAGESLAEQLAGDRLRGVFVLSDGLSVNGTPLVAGLARRLPSDVAISGGLAGDGSRFQQTWVLDKAKPRQHVVCAVGLYGDRLRVATGCDDGWHDFGPQRRITRADGNVLFELDGKPALDLYKTYLGKLAAELPGSALLFPLSIRKPGSSDRPVIRTILGIDEDQRSLTFAGDVPVGYEARLMRSNDERLIASAAAAIAQATEGLAPQSRPLIISVSCVGRRLMLGERVEEEIESVAGDGTRCVGHVGFYSYGEIAPGFEGGASELHNQTITVTAISEV